MENIPSSGEPPQNGPPEAAEVQSEVRSCCRSSAAERCAQIPENNDDPQWFSIILSDDEKSRLKELAELDVDLSTHKFSERPGGVKR
jgi:hypothetical protein